LRSIKLGERLAMFDDHLVDRPKGRTSESLPLFYRKKIRANGEIEELSLGPSLVSLFKWVFIAGAIAATFRDAESKLLLKLLLRLLP
jgi:hypothetical protein